MPYQCFINGKFEDAENGKSYDTINPTDGSVSPSIHLSVCPSIRSSIRFIQPFPLQVICKVSYASVADVDRAVAAAKEAFDSGPWGRMNPRDRGSLLYK